jgi:hypothetical protein
MSRLFITSREMQLINDLTKEFIKDCVGQYIVYYPVSYMKTNVDIVYQEAAEKIFNNPIKLDALVGQVERENQFDSFSISQKSGKVEVFVQTRDLIDKNISLSIGDYFVYGEHTFEILNVVETKNIFGQEDYSVAYTITGEMSFASQFDINVFNHLWQDAQKFKDKRGNKTFEQQRGLSETDNNGSTGDIRQVRQRLGEEMAPIALGEGPRKIEPDNVINDTTIAPEEGNSFYNE